MFNAADDDFNQLQVETADGNDGDVMLRLRGQSVKGYAFIVSGIRVIDSIFRGLS